MRRLLTIFLAFNLLLPSLVCAMPVCSQPLPIDSSMPCHSRMSHSQTSHSQMSHAHKSFGKTSHDQLNNDQFNFDTPMILQDCTGVDLHVTGDIVNSVIQDGDRNAIDLSVLWAEADYLSASATQSLSRAPPDSLRLTYLRPSIVLTTQRFRI